MEDSDNDDEAPCLVVLEDDNHHDQGTETSRDNNEDLRQVSAPSECHSKEQEPPLLPCPVTILSGFLGSGKTTLIRYILQSPNHGKRIAVIENEFAESQGDEEVGLNVESMIARDGLQDRGNLIDLIELPNGCICCTVKDSLVVTLEALLEKRRDLDYILIECSGMANPGPIASLFWLDNALESRLTLDGIVTVVDAANIMEQLRTTEEAIQQIAYADRILLNKIDLVEKSSLDDILKLIHHVHPTVRIKETEYSKVPDLGWILDTRSFDEQRNRDLETQLSNESNLDHNHDHKSNDSCHLCRDHRHTDAVSTCTLTLDGSISLPRLNRWLAEILWPNQDEQDKVLREKLESGMKGMFVEDKSVPKIFRIKGILAVQHDRDVPNDDTVGPYVDEKGLDTRRYILQAVHDLWEIFPSSNDLMWKVDEPRRCKIIVIGRRLDIPSLREGFHKCAWAG